MPKVVVLRRMHPSPIFSACLLLSLRVLSCGPFWSFPFKFFILNTSSWFNMQLVSFEVMGMLDSKWWGAPPRLGASHPWWSFLFVSSVLVFSSSPIDIYMARNLRDGVSVSRGGGRLVNIELFGLECLTSITLFALVQSKIRAAHWCKRQKKSFLTSTDALWNHFNYSKRNNTFLILLQQ